jgi:signal transduction histidine kinase
MSDDERTSRTIDDDETLQLLVKREAVEALDREGLRIRVEIAPRGHAADAGDALDRALGSLRRSERGLAVLQKLSTVGQMGAGITHEVRNLMTGIRGFAQVGLKKAADRPQLLELFRMIEAETARSLELLAGFLDYARPAVQPKGRLDIGTVIADAVKLVRHELQLHHVQITVDVAEGLPIVQGSASKLQQVLLNLALNAMQAMPGGGRILVKATADGESLVVSVKDTGSGLSDAIQGSIFEPFVTTKAPGKGTGLGLFVSRGIVREHGGDLTVESQPGEGATFVIRLPAASGANK